MKCANSHPAYRWPATWGPNFDWLPDQDHGGNLLETTQFMLLQSDGDVIRLLPAWPKDWDVQFKLHAPHRTTVECVYRGGKIERLRVEPESRRKDVVCSLAPLPEPPASKGRPMNVVVFGVFLHAVAALFAANCYAPQKYIKRWSWEIFWLTQAAWCWLLWPIIGAMLYDSPSRTSSGRIAATADALLPPDGHGLSASAARLSTSQSGISAFR